MVGCPGSLKTLSEDSCWEPPLMQGIKELRQTEKHRRISTEISEDDINAVQPILILIPSRCAFTICCCFIIITYQYPSCCEIRTKD